MLSVSRLIVAMRLLVAMAIILLIAQPTLNWLGEGRPAPPLAGLALAIIPNVLVALGLTQLLTFCQRVRQGGAFTMAAAAALGRLGFALIAASLTLPIVRLAADLVARGGEIGRLPLLASAMGLIFGLVFVVFGALLRDAQKLAEENAGFV